MQSKALTAPRRRSNRGDKHYLTDVLAGAAFGGAIGFAVPYWIHRASPRGRGDSVLSPGWNYGPAFSWTGTF